ncbi:MAG: hypothetical protein QF366_04440 [Candidatus Poseidoniia archaeon]|nr:hypothetical protein [Candidatus Poseidoniia archaeon]
MAKKKKGEKAEPSFVFPEFDRTEWLEKEVRDSKAGLIGVAWALLVGLMSWQLSLATGQARYGLLFGFSACFAIIKILPLVIDTSSFERKSWAGPILTAVFAWLGVFILLSNPPFSDIAPPRVGALDFYIEDNDGWNTTVVPDADAPLLFVVDLRDNREVTEARLALKKEGGAGQPLDDAAYGRLQPLPAGNVWGVAASYGWYFLLDEGLDTGSYTARITAFDEQGNEKQRSFLLDVA